MAWREKEKNGSARVMQNFEKWKRPSNENSGKIIRQNGKLIGPAKNDGVLGTGFFY